jgi:hypothetical protein
MTGSGKSCLAAAALDNKQLVIEKFKVSKTVTQIMIQVSLIL